MVNPIGGKLFFRTRGGILCLLSFLLLLSSFSAQKIVCTVNQDVWSGKYGQVTISGLGKEIEQFRTTTFSNKEWAQFYTVKVEGATRPMLGSYEVTDTDLIFKPRFLPDPQVSYEVNFSSDAVRKFVTDFSLDVESSWVIRFERAAAHSAEVLGIFPQSDVLPANILRLYVEFSEPMSFENPHAFILIEDQDGRPVMGPFVEIEEGLWNANRTRLTLLLHPGRIKRGVGPNMTQGEIFKQNQKYSLKISSAWNAGTGDGLKESFTKTFVIAEAMRTIIDIESWKIDTPIAGTNQPLVVQTNRLLDKALAERMIFVIGSDGNLVKGKFEYDGSESSLSFNARRLWRAGAYQLKINPKLEDVCGNTPVNVFDLEGSGEKVIKENLGLAFTID